MTRKDTIIALATAQGMAAIAVLRISGTNAISMVANNFQMPGNKLLKEQDSHTIHLGYIKDGDRTLDQVLVSIFKAPNSYTGEEVVEISCHGSIYIQRQILQLFLDKGCSLAEPGEFTLRAFLNGKLDLSQAEAVADLIASESEASHKVAIQQMRGGISHEIKLLRDELLHFASLIELELDFAEEDVEFADRKDLSELLLKIHGVLQKLVDSFALGNVLKNGIPTAIVGEPNVGKSTLLNVLLKEDRAIVSEIAGTTRDSIEDEMIIGGVSFRFIDTAGLRATEDTIESIGIKRTYEKISKASVVILLVEATDYLYKDVQVHSRFKELANDYPDKSLMLVLNKSDEVDAHQIRDIYNSLALEKEINSVVISAKTGEGIDQLQHKLLEFIDKGMLQNNETVVTNSRHYEALQKALQAIDQVREGMDGSLSGDLLAIDIRQALHHLGEITGEITTDDLLGNIFANFCIGK
ncbi:MAG: tRNA uridine-5-carboxymethylaminomethyl(34) synthesis GTPase MnmE [Flavobacteriaceae bacterium]